MCESCWQDHGSPTEWTPQTARFIALVEKLYGELGHSTGGPLHVAIEDWNLDDTVEPYYTLADNAETRAVCDEIAAILNGWTTTQRYSAMAFADGFVSPPIVIHAASGAGVATFTLGGSCCETLGGTFSRHAFPEDGDECWCGATQRIREA